VSNWRPVAGVLAHASVGKTDYVLEESTTPGYVEFRRSSGPGVTVFIPIELITNYVANLKRAELNALSDADIIKRILK